MSKCKLWKESLNSDCQQFHQHSTVQSSYVVYMLGTVYNLYLHLRLRINLSRLLLASECREHLLKYNTKDKNLDEEVKNS